MITRAVGFLVAWLALSLGLTWLWYEYPLQFFDVPNLLRVAANSFWGIADGEAAYDREFALMFVTCSVVAVLQLLIALAIYRARKKSSPKSIREARS
jgi:hypothetical protein